MNVLPLFMQLDLRAMRDTFNLRGTAFSVLVFAGLSFAGTAGAEPRITQKCRDGWATTVLLEVSHNSPLLNTITQAVQQPASDPGLFDRLWQPEGVRSSNSSYYASISLHYPASQDVREIRASVRLDPLLQSPDVKSIWLDGDYLCFATLPDMPYVTMTEFHNAALNHYALAVGPGETEFVEQGHWGPGWVKTGETLSAPKLASICRHTQVVQRFASLRDQWPPSLFYTVRPEVCGHLRNHNAGWRYLANAFGAVIPENGVCPASHPAPVYQLFNNRPDVNQANHRYTSKLGIYNSMQTQGWVGEGVAFCI